MTSSQRNAEFYRAANIEAARIIAADPVKYPGGIQEWAAMILNPPAEGAATRRAA